MAHTTIQVQAAGTTVSQIRDERGRIVCADCGSVAFSSRVICSACFTAGLAEVAARAWRVG